ncbi:3'-5' exonuclease [Anaerobacillus alkaliphilus]|uniref:3'-5' exonuclease n=1 Tax=Anaerobacillus alkaliphilus TaxID=1548597 RepID=UPI001F501DCA|nr:3'-5' exonuclease [Anaerobacillus alkaliphilus]
MRQFVFFDFEMLCSKEGMSYANMESIRLGAAKYDIDTQKITYFDRFIKPKQTEPLSIFCKELTQISDNDIASADSFPLVLDDFIKWIGNIKQSRFFSWSSNDISRLELDAFSHDVPRSKIAPIKNRYVDFQAIFSKRVSKTNPSVENALALYGLQFEGDKHNPMYDAYNTLRIYLAFSEEFVKTDLIMLNQFIFQNQEVTVEDDINGRLKTLLKEDLQHLFNDISIISNIRSAKKLLKRTGKLVKKYENILLNRSRMFNEEILLYVRLLVDFYHNLIGSYNKHYSYGCKIIIFHEHMTTPLQQITA